MRLLLDTHLLLWSQIWPERLPGAAGKLILDQGNALLFSTVSIAEVSIKRALNKPDFAVDAGLLRKTLIEEGYQELPLLGEHACALADLPAIHKDPFDRMLVAQARVEGVTLLTADAAVAEYGGVVRLV